ncbi:hypothetical protein KKC94_03025, partial [Patescibacteria group bacterium]|nr:hypothetical protein [Patescibacteria group bacterium]
LKKAYKKLQEHYGDKMLNFSERTVCEIHRNSQMLRGAYVDWKVNGVILNGQGDISDESQVTLNGIILNDYSEAVLAHELVHLYMQSAYFASTAFLEGHAHAIQKQLYGVLGYRTGRQNGILYNQIAESGEWDDVFKVGLDYSMWEKGSKGGIVDNQMDTLTVFHWGTEWAGFFDNHPGFSRSFYDKMASDKANGKLVFNRADLIELAEESSVDFEAWYAKQTSMHPIGTTANNTVNLAYVDADKKKVAILNLQGDAGRQEGNAIHPGWVHAFVLGDIEIKDFNGVSLQLGQPEYNEVLLTGNFSGTPVDFSKGVTVKIGDVVVPVLPTKAF